MKVEDRGNGAIAFVCNDEKERDIIAEHYDELKAFFEMLVKENKEV